MTVNEDQDVIELDVDWLNEHHVCYLWVICEVFEQRETNIGDRGQRRWGSSSNCYKKTLCHFLLNNNHEKTILIFN